MTSNYVAIYLPGPKAFDKKGFYTKEEAWRWVESRLCRMCKASLKAGYMTVNEGTSDEDIIDIVDVPSTMCGSQWDVLPQQTYDEFNPPIIEDNNKL